MGFFLPAAQSTTVPDGLSPLSQHSLGSHLLGMLDPVMTSAGEARKRSGQALHLEMFFLPRTTCFQGLHTNMAGVISMLHHLLLILVDLGKSILISFLPHMFLKTKVKDNE